MGRDKQLELEDGGSPPETAAGGPLDSSYFLPVTGGLPHEASDEWPQSAAAATPEENHRQLLDFFRYGIRSAQPAGHTDAFHVVPALTYPYCDLSRTRHAFPFCLDRERAPGAAVQTLPGIIDGLIEQIDISGDAGERLKQQIYRLESEIRKLAVQEHGAGILGLWDRAARNLINESRYDDQQKAVLRDNLAAARQVLKSDHEMIACDAAMPERLLRGLLGVYWNDRCKEWRGELDSLIQGLTDILEADFSHSPAARSAAHLRESSGTKTDDIDFSAFSSILTTSRAQHQIPAQRRDRIRAALDTLVRVRPVYCSAGQDEDAATPFPVLAVLQDCQSALQDFNVRMGIMTDFFKAVQIARLECNNAYRETVHDAYYGRFDVTCLTETELRLCPPLLLKLEQGSVADGAFTRLLEVLNTGYPIKVLLLIDDLCTPTRCADQTSILIDWPARLAHMVMAMTSVYVMQAPVSGLGLLHEGFLAGLRYGGPALFSVYTGNRERRPDLPLYLDAGSAMESRIFPAFSYDPAAGPGLAERMEVRNNNQPGWAWPLESFKYRAADGNDSALETGFTAADFLLNDQRLAQHFWNLPRSLWHEQMVPLHDYLQLDTDSATEQVPYILTVNQAGEVGRSLVSRAIVASVMHCHGAWRYLQELGGIDNSHAARLMAQQEARIAEQKQRELAAMEAHYRLQMDQDLGRLTQEIVRRIAQQLILEPGTAQLVPAPPAIRQPVTAPVAPAATPAEIAEAAVPAAGSQEEEEDELEGMDDPYIVTQLCTSCNDCININKNLFGYDNDKRAYIKDPAAGTFADLVRAAEKCPVHIIHPGKPKNPDEAGLEDLLKRAARYL